MILFGKEIAGRLIAMVAGAILLFAIIAFAVSQCSSRKTAKKEAEVAEGQAGAAIDSGAVAVDTAANIIASDASTDAQVAAAQATIAAAAKGQKGAAAKREACKFRAYKDSPQCKEPVR